jgi:WD40 repeat protein
LQKHTKEQQSNSLLMSTFWIETCSLLSRRSQTGDWISNFGVSGVCGIAEDVDNQTLYVCCTDENAIYKINRQRVSILASAEISYAIMKGLLFCRPCGIVFDEHQKVLFVADTFNNSIKQVNLDGTVKTVAENDREYIHKRTKYANLHYPMYLAFTKDKKLLITDSENNRIKILDTKTGILNTLAGSSKGFKDGDALSSKFWKPIGITVAKDGNIFVSDSCNFSIRKIGLDGKVSTLYKGIIRTLSAYINLPEIMVWNLLIVDDLLISTYQYDNGLWICKVEKTGLHPLDVKYLNPIETPLGKCKALTLSADGTILVSSPEDSRIVRIRVVNISTIGKGSEEEGLV